MKRIIATTFAGAILASGCSSAPEGSPETSSSPLLPPITITETTAYTSSTIPAPTSPSSTETALTIPSAPSTTFGLPESVYNPSCAVQIQPGDTLTKVATAAGVSLQDLVTENGIANPDLIEALEPLDICIDGIDDLGTGEPRVVPTTTPPEAATTPPATTLPETTTTIEIPSGVAAQQTQLNLLLGPYGMTPLEVDGQSGALTKQQLCAARTVLGLPISRNDMDPGGEEERLLLSTTALSAPQSPVVNEGKWVVVEQTCQVMFIGQDQALQFVFPTSTGQPDYPTRLGSFQAHRYDPAVENNGWHDSTLFPAADDNPLNGNMYRPVYFNRGQAVHGANNVPAEPASHGCARLSTTNQDRFIEWLGLAGVTEQTYKLPSLVDLEVAVQGSY